MIYNQLIYYRRNLMSEELLISEKFTSTPYEDHEFPNIRYDIIKIIYSNKIVIGL